MSWICCDDDSGGGLLLYYLCLLYVHYEQYYQNDSPSSSIGLLLLHGCNDALSRKWQLNIGTMAQHGCTSGAASDDVLPPRIAEAGLSMHLSVTYHSPNCRRKSNLLSLFSVHDLSNGVYRAILAVSVGEDCWKPDSVEIHSHVEDIWFCFPFHKLFHESIISMIVISS